MIMKKNDDEDEDEAHDERAGHVDVGRGEALTAPAIAWWGARVVAWRGFGGRRWSGRVGGGGGSGVGGTSGRGAGAGGGRGARVRTMLRTALEMGQAASLTDRWWRPNSLDLEAR